VAAVVVSLGLGPIVAQSLASSASAQSTNCSASTTGEALLNESSFVASTNATSGSGDEPQNAITNAVENSNSTRFSTDEGQAVGQYYEVNMGSAQTFNEVQIQVPNSATDYARGYNINVSPNGSTWTTVASCTGTGTPEIASFTTVTDQYLEVVLTAADSSYWWSIDQFDIYNASSTTTTTTASSINSSDYYEVVNENSGLCEEPAGGATANGTAVEQEPCASPATSAQEWQFVPAGSGAYEVLNVNGASGGESWNVTGGTGATASGDLIQIWAYGDATNEQWDATSVTGGYYTFTALNSGLCLDTPSASTASGVQLQQYTCNGTGAQEFKLVQESGSTTTTTAATTTTTKPTTTTTTKPTTTTTTKPTTTTTTSPSSINSSDYYEVVNENSGLCEEPAGGATANGTAVEQVSCASPATAAQEWQFVSVGSGDYEVVNVNGASGGESWNVTGGTGATASGDPVQIWAYGGATNEKWEATSVAGGYFNFIALNSGLCLDTPGASTASGVQLQQYTCNGTGAQEFKLVVA
jgi:hypothetical protein